MQMRASEDVLASRKISQVDGRRYTDLSLDNVKVGVTHQLAEWMHECHERIVYL